MQLFLLAFAFAVSFLALRLGGFGALLLAVMLIFVPLYVIAGWLRNRFLHWELRRVKNMPSAAELDYRFHKRMGNIP